MSLPSPHTLLGIVKKHVVAMEEQVHELIDTQKAKKLKPNTDMKTTTELFRCYARTCKNIKDAEDKVKKYRDRGLKRKQAKQEANLADLKKKS